MAFRTADHDEQLQRILGLISGAATDTQTGKAIGEDERVSPRQISSPPFSTAGWKELVVLLAANSYDEPKVADRHLAETLSKHVPVLYVDRPVSKLTPLRQPDLRDSVASPGLRLLTPRLARLTPVVQPGMLRSGLASLTAALTRHICANAVQSLGLPVRAFISTSPILPVFGACNEAMSVYWAQDDFIAGADLMGVSSALIRRREPKIADTADVIVASSPKVFSDWQQRGFEPKFIPYGCDVEAFADVKSAPHPLDVTLPAPRVGMVGRLNDRLDLAILEEIAERNHSLLLVGPRDEHYARAKVDRLLARPNVEWVGPKAFEELPGYLGSLAVGIVPYRDIAFNRASFPLKTLEYLSAGLPVVSTDLPSTRWLGIDSVALRDSPADFADAVEFFMNAPNEIAAVKKRQEAAALHSWRQRANDFAELLELG